MKQFGDKIKEKNMNVFERRKKTTKFAIVLHSIFALFISISVLFILKLQIIIWCSESS